MHQDANRIQQYFSSDRRPTLWHALLAFEWLQTAWELKANDQKYQLYKHTLTDGLRKLKKYYTHFDEKPAYVLVLGMLHPPYLLLYSPCFQSFTHITSSTISRWHGGVRRNSLQRYRLATGMPKIGNRRQSSSSKRRYMFFRTSACMSNRIHIDG
jgi:hypothetical protein